MFIAMNRFKVVHGDEDKFETMWKTRESFLQDVPDFAGFALLRGPREADHTLYASHTRWETRDAFEAWTRSDAFRKAHANAGTRDEADKPAYLGPPRFEGFEAVHTIPAPGEES